MKNINKIVVMLALIILGTYKAKAASCSNSVSKDLYSQATHIKFEYTVNDNSITKELTVDKDKTTYTIPNYEFEITLYNLTENLYAEIKENVFNSSTIVRYENTTDGNYIIKNSDFGRIYNYTVTIYSNNSDCYGKKIKTLKLTKPMYNAYSEYTYCQNSTNYYCQKFTTKDLKIADTEDFLKKVSVNNERNKEEEADNTIIKLVKNNWKLYIIILLVIILLPILILYIIKKRKEKAGWRL